MFALLAGRGAMGVQWGRNGGAMRGRAHIAGGSPWSGVKDRRLSVAAVSREKQGSRVSLFWAEHLKIKKLRARVGWLFQNNILIMHLLCRKYAHFSGETQCVLLKWAKIKPANGFSASIGGLFRG